MDREIVDKSYSQLLNWFKQFRHIYLAFSGGVDSSFLLKAAVDSSGNDNVTAVIGVSPSLAKSELESAINFAKNHRANYVLLETKELDNPLYQKNSGNRCYYCKKTLYQTIKNNIRLNPDTDVLIDGKNIDDLNDIRPGQLAAKEEGIRHPLVENNFNKELIRNCSKLLNLDTADKQSMACLASRVAVGNNVSLEKLNLIENAENLLRSLGFSHFRVRYHELKGVGNTQVKLARIEFEHSEKNFPILEMKKDLVVQRLKEIGFSFITIDLEGYKKGGRATP